MSQSPVPSSDGALKESSSQSPVPGAADSNYILVDIGANLTNKKYLRDQDSVVQRAKDSGVKKIICSGFNVNVSKEALRLTRIYPDVIFSTAGIHPHDAKSWDSDSEVELEKLCQNSECVAVGECGLDFNRNFSPPDVQLEVFEKQVQLACKLRKPMFLHERDAHTDMVRILQKYSATDNGANVLPLDLSKCVIHCFTGTVDQAKTYLGMGLYIGITGYIWKDKGDNGVRKLLTDNLIPLDRLLVETDAPFMYPNTRSAKLSADIKQILSQKAFNFLNRYCTFQRNEPCSLPATVELISSLMEKSPEEVAMATTYNAVKIFGLTNA
jgi:TatD DNase family protein